MKVTADAFLTAVPVGGAAWAEAPSCAGEVEIADAHIPRVEHNGMLILTDGRRWRSRVSAFRSPPRIARHRLITDAAFAELNSLAKGQVVNAHAIWPKEDRYDRVRAQIFTPDGTWLQTDLLSKGLARVEIAPDRGECYRELYDAEIAARAAHLGIWSDTAYAVRTADNVAADIGTFQIVMGTVLNAATKDGRVYLNLGRIGKPISRLPSRLTT